MAGVLLLAAGLKVMSLVYPTRWLNQPNAILPLTERWVLVLAIAVDVGVPLALLSRKMDRATKLNIRGWLLGLFAITIRYVDRSASPISSTRMVMRCWTMPL